MFDDIFKSVWIFQKKYSYNRFSIHCGIERKIKLNKVFIFIMGLLLKVIINFLRKRVFNSMSELCSA